QEDGEAGNAVLQHELEDDVEDHEVQRRVQHRPDEAQDAVLVLDLQLLADESHEQLAEAPDLRYSLPHARPVGDDAGRLGVAPAHVFFLWSAGRSYLPGRRISQGRLRPRTGSAWRRRP